MRKLTYDRGSISVEFVFVLFPVIITVLYLLIVTIQTVESDMIRYATVASAREARDFNGNSNPSLYKEQFKIKFMDTIKNLPLVPKNISDYNFDVQGFKDTKALINDNHVDISNCQNCLFAKYSVSYAIFGVGKNLSAKFNSAIVMGQEHEGW